MRPLLGWRCYWIDEGYVMSEWVKCSERMPPHDVKVLLFFADYDGHIEDGFISDDGDGAYHYLFDGDALGEMPTHWMPLPEPPAD